MKKIFMYIYSLHTGGGAENVLYKLALFLHKKGWQVYVCGMLDEEPSFEKSLTARGLKVIRLQSDHNPLRTIPRLVKVLKKVKPDILLNWLYPCIITGGIAGRIASVPCLISNLRGPDLKKKKLKVLLDGIVARCCYDGHIAVSQNVKDVFVRREKYPADKVAVINNGLDLAAEKRIHKTSRSASRRALRLSSKNIVIGTLGRLYPEKNQQLLIKAFALLASRLPEARLLLVGDGPSRQELEHLSAELNISDKIIFTGWQSDPYPYLQAMDIYVLPSLYEGHSSSILQAWACRLPVIGANTTGIRDLIVDGQNGLLFSLKNPQELANIILNLPAYPKFTKKLAAAGYQTVSENYTEQKMYAEYLNYLENSPAQNLRLRR
ncbi:glycosyl transferase GTB-type super family [Candidatus Termititenax aidoneus]|uniref:Glycosyl transferase GTB-type super family n=1 Tax=Termititenax aidoneus TaxID=2218524 RepID=A0A388TCS8_TERA1|nr:glycosyl transferase GTB-type super family [Candidatus Termititenax aidoneus]